MEYLGVKFDLKNVPALDPGFIPFGVWMDAYLKDAKTPIAIAVERQEGQISVRKTFIHGTAEMAKADYRYVSYSYTYVPITVVAPRSCESSETASCIFNNSPSAFLT